MVRGHERLVASTGRARRPASVLRAGDADETGPYERNPRLMCCSSRIAVVNAFFLYRILRALGKLKVFKKVSRGFTRFGQPARSEFRR